MESMGILGFIFGLSALSYAIKIQGEITTIKEEFETLNKRLKDSGALKD